MILPNHPILDPIFDGVLFTLAGFVAVSAVVFVAKLLNSSGNVKAMSGVQPNRRRQAGAEVEITEEMITAGVGAYEEWEPDHLFPETGSPSPYAIRELALRIYLSMAAARNRGG